MGKQNFNADRWIAAVEYWEKTGTSKKRYCIEHELTYSTFCYWTRKLKPESLRNESNSVLRAIEVSSDGVRDAFFKGWPSISADIDTQGIILIVAETDATVTISGRVSLERLVRIMAACETIDHARS